MSKPHRSRVARHEAKVVAKLKIVQEVRAVAGNNDFSLADAERSGAWSAKPSAWSAKPSWIGLRRRSPRRAGLRSRGPEGPRHLREGPIMSRQHRGTGRVFQTTYRDLKRGTWKKTRVCWIAYWHRARNTGSQVTRPVGRTPCGF